VNEKRSIVDGGEREREILQIAHFYIYSTRYITGVSFEKEKKENPQNHTYLNTFKKNHEFK
jgi:hypothetical protein